MRREVIICQPGNLLFIDRSACKLGFLLKKIVADALKKERHPSGQPENPLGLLLSKGVACALRGNEHQVVRFFGRERLDPIKTEDIKERARFQRLVAHLVERPARGRNITRRLVGGLRPQQLEKLWSESRIPRNMVKGIQLQNRMKALIVDLCEDTLKASFS